MTYIALSRALRTAAKKARDEQQKPGTHRADPTVTSQAHVQIPVQPRR